MGICLESDHDNTIDIYFHGMGQWTMGYHGFLPMHSMEKGRLGVIMGSSTHSFIREEPERPEERGDSGNGDGG